MNYKIAQEQLQELPAKKSLSDDDKRAIKKILSIPAWHRFPRCAARSRSFIKSCEATGDYSHSDKNHICETCRCQRVAGSGTSGNFYGLGEHTGHYGCGWCSVHERGRRTKFAKEYAVEHMRLLQGVGMAQNPSEDFEIVAKEQARVATVKREVRGQIELVRKTLEDFIDALKPESKVESDAIAEQLKVFAELFATNGGLEKKELEAVMQLINMAILIRTTMTESGRGGPVPMSDDTRMHNIREFAKVLASLSLDEFKVTEGDFVRGDEVKIRLARTMDMLKRFIASKEDWAKMTSEMLSVWGSLRSTQ